MAVSPKQIEVSFKTPKLGEVYTPKIRESEEEHPKESVFITRYLPAEKATLFGNVVESCHK